MKKIQSKDHPNTRFNSSNSLSFGCQSLVSFFCRSESDTLSFGQRDVGLGCLSNNTTRCYSVEEEQNVSDFIKMSIIKNSLKDQKD